MEEIKLCPVCSSDQLRFFLTCADHLASQKKFDIVQCQQCGFKFTNPRPDEKEIAPYYASSEYISHSNSNKGMLNQLYQLARKYTLKSKRRLIQSQHPLAGNLLDYGCGTGEFLHTCQQAGWKVWGLEPDANARKQASALLEKPVFEKIAELDKLEERFDCITLWHVLEHIHHLEETVLTLRNLLSSGGSLWFALPNCDSYDAKYYGKFWAAWDLPRHLYHFSPITLEKFLSRVGLILHRKIPMYLDAFYISLLSEKYEKGKMNYFNAFGRGLKSNLWAAKNHSNYSSMIYITQIKSRKN